MKFETLMLQGLSAACLVVCLLTLGAMLATTPASTMATSPVPTVAAMNAAG